MRRWTLRRKMEIGEVKDERGMRDPPGRIESSQRMMIISIKMWMKRMMGGSLGGGGSFGQNKRGLKCITH